MSEKINKLVEEKLDKIFADYPTTKDLTELKEELLSDLIASAEDKLASESDEEAAVEKAFRDFGDIDDVITQVLQDDDSNTKEKHQTSHHRIDLDDEGVRIDNGKTLNIDSNGITINDGKSVRIDSDGVKLGNMVIDEDEISFGNHKKTNFDNFDAHFKAQFNDTDFDTEVHVESLPLADTNELDLTDIKTIAIAYESAVLKVLPTKGDKIVVREYMSRANPDYQVRTKVVGDTLKIVQGKIPHFLPLKIKVQVLIPNNFSGQLKVNDHSGNLTVQNLSSIDETLINVRSGMVNVRNMVVKKLLISSASGKIVLEDLNASQQLAIESKSSVVNLDNVYSPNYSISAKSGTIKTVDLGGAGKINAKSGIIKVDFAKVTGNVSVENVSGTIKLTMPENDSYNFDLEAQSGTVKIHQTAKFKHDVLSLKEGTVGNDPQYTLTARAKSGTIKVN